MTELWRQMDRLNFERTGDRNDLNFKALEGWAPEEVVVEDTGAADTVVALAHGLRRIPRGVTIVNQVTAPGDGAVGWYRESTDDAWTMRVLTLRFTVANAAVRLWIW